MPDYSAALGLDAARLERQVKFLQDRADWHRRRETPVDLATAAALLRDAGLISLLLGKVALAQRELDRAGTDLISIGLFAGYLLWRFAGTDRLDGEVIDRMTAGIRAGSREGGAAGDHLTPFERASEQSPRQLLSLYQAIHSGRTRDRRADIAAAAASERLKFHDGMTVGLTGMSVGSYAQMFDRCGEDNMTHRDLDTIYATAIQRRELIEAAQRDSYHWRMLLQPAELVDLDLVAFGMNAVQAEGRARSWVLETIPRLGIPAALPFLLARDLRELSSQ